MATVDELKILIKAETRQLKKELDQVNRKLSTTNQQAQKSSAMLTAGFKKAALGIANAPIASADLDPGLYTKLTELGTDQSTAKLQEVKDAFERPANNYFVDVEDGKAGNLINPDKVETVFRFLEEVANANEYDDEQQEIWFDILAAIDIELLRVKGLRDGRRNRNRYEYWQELRDSAETEWFS